MSDSEENEQVVVQAKASKKSLKRKQVQKDKKSGAGKPGAGKPGAGKPPPKKANNGSPKKKIETPSSDVEAEESSSDEDAPEPTKAAPMESVVDLGKNVHVRVNEFKSRVFVDIREYYQHKDNGNLRPGKKGMALTPAMWKILKDNISLIDEALATKT